MASATAVSSPSSAGGEKIGEVDKAQEAYREAIRQNPRFPESFNTYMTEKQFQELYEDFGDREERLPFANGTSINLAAKPPAYQPWLLLRTSPPPPFLYARRREQAPRHGNDANELI